MKQQIIGIFVTIIYICCTYATNGGAKPDFYVEIYYKYSSTVNNLRCSRIANRSVIPAI
jgi:hypothetical protein